MLPNPETQPLLRPADIVGLHPALRRTAVYDAIKKGDIPSLTIGGRIYIPTAELRRMLRLDGDRPGPDQASVPIEVENEPGQSADAGGGSRSSCDAIPA